MKAVCILILLLTGLNVQSQDIFLEGELNEKTHLVHPRQFPELYYEVFIAELNKKTEITLFYDEDVQYYINLFLNERKDQFPVFYQRSSLYFPLFEKYLSEYNIPGELKYLPVLESGLSPDAVSPSMAIGLWQFKEKTGSYYGLNITEFQDDRRDPELSTIAACKYLSRLYQSFQSWELSLIAYNAGPTFLRNTQKKLNNTTDYRTLYPHLTPPAKKYLPALVAIIYLFENYDNHFTAFPN